MQQMSDKLNQTQEDTRRLFQSILLHILRAYSKKNTQTISDFDIFSLVMWGEKLSTA